MVRFRYQSKSRPVLGTSCSVFRSILTVCQVYFAQHVLNGMEIPKTDMNVTEKSKKEHCALYHIKFLNEIRACCYYVFLARCKNGYRTELK